MEYHPRRPDKLIFYIRALKGNREAIEAKKTILSTREKRRTRRKNKQRENMKENDRK